MRLERLSTEEWGAALPASGFEVFHTPAALAVLDDHAEGDLVLYGGFKGDQPVALFPAFVQDRAVGRAVLSPPPGFAVSQLGPILMPTSPKRRKREKVNRNFAEALVEELDVDSRLTLFRAVCHAAFPDPRPYVWSDLSLSTAFTYRLPIDDDTDSILGSFSKSLRREIRDARDLDVTVDVEGVSGTEAVFERTRERYAEQGRGFSLSWPYVRDLTESLAAEDRARTYVVRDADGDLLSGVVVLYSNDVAYYWLGGTRTVHDGVSVNSLLHWRIIEDVAAAPPRDSVAGYDLVGANTERLCRYKSKFGADLVPYYVLESSGPGMDVAKAAYRMVSR
jgi:hypothetical protein